MHKKHKEFSPMSILSQFWFNIQTKLFPYLEEELGHMPEKQKELIKVLELVRIEEHIKSPWWSLGRPLKDRKALARSYIAKMVYNLSTTKDLIDRLGCDRILRQICGWEKKEEIPSESTFSRGFDEFSDSLLPSHVHEAMIKKYTNTRIVGHISRDSTDILLREKSEKKTKAAEKDVVKYKRGRPKKDEKRIAKKDYRLSRQRFMSLKEMMNELPVECDIGVKKKSGKNYYWKGRKLHIDWGDGEVPIICILTSASLHDSQAAIPLAKMSY
jgi:hypothetical protein